MTRPTLKRGPSTKLRPGLYLITPDDPDPARLLARTRPLLPFASCLQLRNKAMDAASLRDAGERLRAACMDAGIPFIVNDDATLAADLGADGVHLGEDDGDLAAARAALGPQAIIGASCYDELDLARRAVAAGASYVAFGAFFPTRSKVTTRRATPALLGEAAALGVPRVAIGGITPANAGALVAAGADLVAVIGGVFDAPDPRAAVRAYAACFL